LNPPPPNQLSPDPARISELRRLLTLHRLQPRKSLGQNFLISPVTADRIVQLLDLSPGDKVLEIGPGPGALTLRLAAAGAEILALELDRGLADLLGELLAGYGAKRIIAGDVLEADFPALLGEGGWKVVGNLPYNLTGPILGKILEAVGGFHRVVLMLQKEVAARLLSPPGSKEYGAVSVLAQCYFDLRREMVVKGSAFYPRPEVDSAVISLVPKTEPAVGVGEQAEFRRLLQAAFAHRRKKLENSLQDAGLVESRERGEELLASAGIGLGRRAEALSLAEFVGLFQEGRTKADNEFD
jgi:16S rRNA (adenine1518-N6/adenine1519-N6)-dimethyltransferase